MVRRASYLALLKETKMNKLNSQKAKVVGWFGLGMSIVCFAIYIFKSAAGRDPSPALILVGIATGLGAATMLAGAKKLPKP